MALPGTYGSAAVTRLRACLLACFLAIAVVLSACGKKGDAERGAEGTAGEAKAAGDSAARTGPPGHAFDGFYIHRGYLDSLKSSRSIFKTRFPHGTVYLQIHGDSVVMDYGNHEGGNGRLRVDSGSGPLSRPAEGQMGGGDVVFRPQGGASVLAWETGTDSAVEFIKLSKPIRTINQLYGRLLLDGVYRWAGDTVVISGDSIRGLKGGLRRISLAIDWLDNMPQMDFMKVAGADTVSWAYTVSADKLEFFAIDLPKACKSLDDYDCPLTDAKPGKRLLELIRIGGVPAGSERRL
jgi:hypothetical protein